MLVKRSLLEGPERHCPALSAAEHHAPAPGARTRAPGRGARAAPGTSRGWGSSARAGERAGLVSAEKRRGGPGAASST